MIRIENNAKRVVAAFLENTHLCELLEEISYSPAAVDKGVLPSGPGESSFEVLTIE